MVALKSLTDGEPIRFRIGQLDRKFTLGDLNKLVNALPSEKLDKFALLSYVSSIHAEPKKA